MQQNIIQTMIKSFALLEGLPIEEIDEITKVASKRELPAKTTFIEQDSTSDAVYFILEGSVNVYRMNENGEEISLGVLGGGDVVGEMALIDHEPRSAYVTTITTTTVLALSSEDFKTILKKYPNIAIHLLSSLSQRIRNSDQHIEEVLTQNLSTRTWNTLQILKRYFPDEKISLTHEELASIVGATRARITETLNNFQTEGKILLSHRKITFS